MKKTYQNPALEVVNIQTAGMMAVSGGVGTGSTVGNSYNKDDVSYGREQDFDDED